MKFLGYLLLIVAGILALAVVTSLALSPPWLGPSLAKDLDIPRHAVIAHRGASAWAPESTTPAYLAARDMGSHYLEADLQRTKDGVIVAFHDDTLERTTNAARVFPGRETESIGDFTYQELLQLDVGSWFNDAYPDKARESFAGLQILTLDEIIDIAEGGRHRPGLYLESKSAPLYPGIEEDILEILKRRGWIGTSPDLPLPPDGLVDVARGPGRILFQSFYLDSIKAFSELAPEVPRVFLVSQEMADEEGFAALLDAASPYAQGIGSVGYLAWPWNTGRAHRQGFVVHPYTINEVWQMRLVSFFGADGIFTDRPDAALAALTGAAEVDVDFLLQQAGY